MRVLCACECSGRVREAFRKRGHDAWSVDLLPSLDNSPKHVIGDVVGFLASDPNWDVLIGHPPCTYLCNSGVRWLRKPVQPTDWNGFQEWTLNETRWAEMEAAQEFFLTLWNAPIPKICLENPVPHRYAQLPKYSQTIQPYMFGDDASKRTCLWLKGLEPLEIPSSDHWAQPRIVDGKSRWSNQTDSGQNKLPPSEDRGAQRSITYPGIAEAFASNWG